MAFQVFLRAHCRGAVGVATSSGSPYLTRTVGQTYFLAD